MHFFIVPDPRRPILGAVAQAGHHFFRGGIVQGAGHEMRAHRARMHSWFVPQCWLPGGWFVSLSLRVLTRRGESETTLGCKD